MKRIYKTTTVLILIVCVILMTCACAHNPQSDVTDPSQAESLFVDRPGLAIYNYGEYLSFLESTDLPNDFVEFDSLNGFGSFSGFVDLSSSPNPFTPYDYDHYMYTFIDENGYDYAIYVRREANYIPKEDINQEDINLADMRTLSSEQCGIYTMNGFKYNYVNGQLISIRWHHEGMYYCLSIYSSDFVDYPIDTLTPFAKLVNIRDESIAFMKELLQ